MSFIVTKPAAKEIKRNIADRGHGLGIRLMVLGADCSGLAYNLSFEDETDDCDLVFEKNGAKVIIDKKSILFLTGAKLDFLKQGDASGFVIENPNVNHECVCGGSFYV